MIGPLQKKIANAHKAKHTLCHVAMEYYKAIKRNELLIYATN